MEKFYLPEKSLFYLDPPYFVKDKDLYLNYYKPQDHENIARIIEEIKTHKWIVTYDCVPEIQDLYCNYRQVKYMLNYSASKSMKGEELMIFSDNLYISKHKILANEVA